MRSTYYPRKSLYVSPETGWCPKVGCFDPAAGIVFRHRKGSFTSWFLWASGSDGAGTRYAALPGGGGEEINARELGFHDSLMTLYSGAATTIYLGGEWGWKGRRRRGRRAGRRRGIGERAREEEEGEEEEEDGDGIGYVPLAFSHEVVVPPVSVDR